MILNNRLTRTALCATATLLVLGAGDSQPCKADTTGDKEPEVTMPRETPEQRDRRMAWWREAKYGMFIHWGVYAVPAGIYQGRQLPQAGEWIMRMAKIPVAEYRAYAEQFNPVKYDPEAWVRLAKEAGMKYIVITAKHHDGFALYPTEVSDWNVVDATPYGKDLIGPLAEAARKAGLKFGLYYSQSQDWVHPGGHKADYPEGDGWDDAHKGDYDAYLETIAVPQTREILTRYRPDILWWDTPAWMTPERTQPFYELMASNPDLITNDRLGDDRAGDTGTPEQYIPEAGFADRDWETCMTMNDTWGYKSDDDNWKPVEVLLFNLVDIVSKGGNYLLNVGPTADGVIPEPSVERLRAIGRWLEVNGESIYGAGPTPSGTWPFRCTRKPGKLFLHLFEWPEDGRLVIPGLKNKIQTAYLLADPDRRALEVRGGSDGPIVHLPSERPDPINSVVVLEIEGEPMVAE